MITFPADVITGWRKSSYTHFRLKITLNNNKIVHPLEEVAYHIICFSDPMDDSYDNYFFVMQDGSMHQCNETSIYEFLCDNIDIIKNLDTFDEIIELARL